MSASKPAWLHRLIKFCRRLGLSRDPIEELHFQAKSMGFVYPTISTPANTLWWQNYPAFEKLQFLPIAALSGSDQHEIIKAHALLIDLIRSETREYEAMDIGCIEGLSTSGNPLPITSWQPEEHSQVVYPVNNQVDFLRTLSLVMPKHIFAEPMHLLSANWRGERFFWTGERHIKAFISAVAYAKKMRMTYLLPAIVTHFTVKPQALQDLSEHYHVLHIPRRYTTHKLFERMLKEFGIPSISFGLDQYPHIFDILLLPKCNTLADALGMTLKNEGAQDLVQYLFKGNTEMPDIVQPSF